MYQLRLFASRHARGYEIVYDFVEPKILSFLNWLHAHTGDRFDAAITWAEKHMKGLLFDCKMCGDCVLTSTGMACPMNCPKNIRNGPCGGVRDNGNCEVEPEMKCVWVQAWDGAARMKANQEIHIVQFAVDRSRKHSSAWLRMAEQQRAAQAQKTSLAGPTANE